MAALAPDSLRSERARVLYYFEPIPPSAKGGAMQIREALAALQARNIDVGYLQSAERPAHWIKYNIVLSNIWYLLFCVRRVRDADVLAIDYSGRFHALFLALALGWISRRTRLAVFVQSVNFAYRKSLVKNLIDRLVSRIFLRRADMVLAAGRALSTELTRLGVKPERVTTIYPALREELRKSSVIRAPREGATILWVGRFHPIKGLEYLVEAMATLKGMVGLRLVLVGDDGLVPSYTRKIAKLVEDAGLDRRVERRGRVDDPALLARIYSEADIFMVPSLWDTSPIVIVEAMCFGLPIVATTAGGASEWVEDGANGFLTPPRDSQALAAAIRRLVDDPALRERMGQASLERSLRYRDRTWNDVGRQYYEAFLPLLKRQTGPADR